MVLHFTCHMLWSTGGALYTVVSLGAKSRIVIIKIAGRARARRAQGKHLPIVRFVPPPATTQKGNKGAGGGGLNHEGGVGLLAGICGLMDLVVFCQGMAPGCGCGGGGG